MDYSWRVLSPRTLRSATVYGGRLSARIPVPSSQTSSPPSPGRVTRNLRRAGADLAGTHRSRKYAASHLRNIEQHRDWMLRSYTVTFAFVTSCADRSAASDRRGETLLPLRKHSNADNDDLSSHGMRNGRSPTRNRYTPEASDSPLSTGRGRDGRIDAGARLENHVYRQA
jgi:hypothetical protein